MNQPEGVWSALQHSSDPRVRSYLNLEVAMRVSSVEREPVLNAAITAFFRPQDEIHEQLLRRRSESAASLDRCELEHARRWYVNGQGQTMVVIPGPVKVRMGSPATEVGRYDYETQHMRRIGRNFAVAAKAVTMEQYRRFEPKYSRREKTSPEANCPVVGTCVAPGGRVLQLAEPHRGSDRAVVL